jgi:hypothetical protein
MPTSKRRAAHRRRSLHDDEARSLEMLTSRSATMRAMISPLSRTCFRPL